MNKAEVMTALRTKKTLAASNPLYILRMFEGQSSLGVGHVFRSTYP